MTDTTPYHQQQILDSLPDWSKDLHPEHAAALLQAQRRPWLDADGQALPWYAAAPSEDQQALRNAVAKRDQTLRALHKELSALQGITRFCRPLLQRQLPKGLQVDEVQYYTRKAKVEFPVIGETDPVYTPVGEPRFRSALEAALHNFKDELDTPRFSGLQASKTVAGTLPELSLKSFIAICRELDLGQRYQDHLSAIFEGEAAQRISDLSITARQDELRVQTRIALLDKRISLAASTALHALCVDLAPSNYGISQISCQTLTLFGIALHELMIISLSGSAATRVLLYMPGADDEQLKEFASLSDCHRHLREGLQRTSLRQQLVLLAPRALQPSLALRLRRALFENPDERDDSALTPKASVNLDPQLHALPDSPWGPLETRHLQRLKGDARCIAVPTADVDAQARLERLAFWGELGLSVLNVAAVFIPVLNPVLLYIAGAQLLGSLFYATEAWEDGDNAQALAQVESLLVNVAILGLSAVGGQALKGSSFVDSMESIQVEDKPLLWRPDLSGYASDTTLPGDLEPDAIGQYRHQGKTFIRLDGTVYEHVEDASGQWRVRHPTDERAYQPLLRHNGGGSWQLAHESPLDWDIDTLLSREGPTGRDLDAAQRRVALRSTGLAEDVLRRQLIEGRRCPSPLEDALARLAVDEDINRLVRHVRDGTALAAHKNFAINALTALPEWPEDHLLQVFSGSERLGESTFYPRARSDADEVIRISRSELQRGKLATVVLEQISEAHGARLAPVTAAQPVPAEVLQGRMADSLAQARQSLFDSLYRNDVAQASPAAQLLARQFSSLPMKVLEELVDHASPAERLRMASENGRVPLRVAEEARLLQAQIRLDRALLGLHQSTLATTETVELRSALLAAHPELNDSELFEQATGDRQTAARLIGQQAIRPDFRSPLRLSDGRVGYPLSGRGGAPRSRIFSPRSRLENLYPELGSDDLERIQAELGSGAQLSTAIKALESDWRQLRAVLRQWVSDSEDIFERDLRNECAQRLRRAWRREGDAALELDLIDQQQLPVISSRFPTVRTLKIAGLALDALDPGLLACFPSLEALELIGNPGIDMGSVAEALRNARSLRRLKVSGAALSELSTSLQQALAMMPHLRELNLSFNNLTLSEAAIGFLVERRLEVLNLQNNFIALDEAAAARFQDMVHLQRLNLSANPLGNAPDLRFMARLEHLELMRCDLETWPQGLTTLMNQAQYQLRTVELSSNRIHSVPEIDALLQTPFARDAGARLPGRRLNFNYNSLESQTRTRLRRLGIPVYEDEADVPQWQAFWQDGADLARKRIWLDLFDDGQNLSLQEKLELLVRSAEAQHQPLVLRERVWAVLQKATASTELRERLNQVAEQYPTTCGDAGTDAFSALETEVVLFDVEQSLSPLKARWKLLRQLYRRAQVNELADRIASARLERQAMLQREMDGETVALPALDPLDDINASPDAALLLGLVDDIEIRLALRQQLATTLDYPEASNGMLYEVTARLSDKIRSNVTDEVWRRDANADARRAWVIEQPGWRQSLAKAHHNQFEAVTDFWRPGLDYLDYCLDPQAPAVTQLSVSVRTTLEQALEHTLPIVDGQLQRLAITDGQYSAALEAILKEQRAVESGLFDSLTRAVEAD